MKKTQLINSEISRVIALLGHTDTIAIGDMGLPIPDHVERIDLAIIQGNPNLEVVLNAVLEEMFVEHYTIATEAPESFNTLCDECFMKAQGNKPQLLKISHEEFKQQLNHVKAVIRTGEDSPYYNVILRSGVIF